MKRYFLVTVLLILGSALTVKAQEGSSASPSPQGLSTLPYHLFNVVSQDSVIEKLNQYGAMGYRFLAEAMAEGGAYTLIMERSSSGTYQYVYASGTLHGSKFQENLNAHGATGFRYIHGTMGGGPSGGGMFAPPVCVGLMEKALGADEAYEYKVVMPMRQGSFAKDIANAAAAGFQPVEASSLAELAQLGGVPGDRNLVIVERSSRKPSQTGSVASSYRFIGISQLKDRQGRIAENMAEGYRILFAGYGTSGLHSEQSAFFALLEKSPRAAGETHQITQAGKQRQIEHLPLDVPRLKAETEIQGGPVAREYRFLDAQQEGIENQQAVAFVQQLNDAAASGYRTVGKPISRIFHINRWGRPHVKFSVILERSASKLEYQLATADDTPGLSRRLTQLWEQGFRVRPMGLLSNQSAIVERELTSTETKAP
jgi:hypothetical protein